MNKYKYLNNNEKTLHKGSIRFPSGYYVHNNMNV